MLNSKTKLTRSPTMLRCRALREDAHVGPTKRQIESLLNLPPGSVQIMLPNGRKARTDGTIKRLRSTWE